MTSLTLTWAPLLLLALMLASMFVYSVIDAARTARMADEVRWMTETETRADQQHALWLRGDERGLYGQYPPENLSD
jgi:hypothetical protein